MKKWKPKEGEKFWFVLADGIIWATEWHNTKGYESYWKWGNCFRTRREAQHAAGEIRKILKGGR